jgi:hypothetical protein
MSHFKYSRKSFSQNDQRNFKQIRAVFGVKPANGMSRGPQTTSFTIPCVVRGLHAYPNSGAVAEQVAKPNRHGRRHPFALAQTS